MESTRRWAARLMLVLAAYVFAASMLVLRGDYRSDLLQHQIPPMVLARMKGTTGAAVLQHVPGVLARPYILVDPLSVVAVAALAFGRIRLARVSGVAALTVYWLFPIALIVFSTRYGVYPALGIFVERAFLLWAAVLYLITAAAFTWPRKPRRPAED